MRRRHYRNSPAKLLNLTTPNTPWTMNTSNRSSDIRARSWLCVETCWGELFQKIWYGLSVSKTIQTLRCSVCSDQCTIIIFPRGWKPGVSTQLLQTGTKALPLASYRWMTVSGSCKMMVNRSKTLVRLRNKVKVANRSDSTSIRETRSKERDQPTRNAIVLSPLTRKWPTISRNLLLAKEERTKTQKHR